MAACEAWLTSREIEGFCNASPGDCHEETFECSLAGDCGLYCLIIRQRKCQILLLRLFDKKLEDLISESWDQRGMGEVLQGVLSSKS